MDRSTHSQAQLPSDDTLMAQAVHDNSSVTTHSGTKASPLSLHNQKLTMEHTTTEKLEEQNVFPPNSTDRTRTTKGNYVFPFQVAQ